MLKPYFTKFMLRSLFSLLIVSFLSACTVSMTIDEPGTAGVVKEFDAIKSNQLALRQFVQTMPKGGDLHNHLSGAVYAESWIDWAEQDGMCLDKTGPGIRYPSANGCGALSSVKDALAGNQILRNELIDNLSLRDYVAHTGWSGHDQFFDTFMSMAAMPSRFGDMLADAANLAGRQNISYLELMHTLALFDTIMPMVGGLKMSGDAAEDYKKIMGSEFGQSIPALVERSKKVIDAAMARKDDILNCGTEAAAPGCSVEIRFLSQNIRTIPASATFAHFIYSWHLMEADERVVGVNLVAPEDDYIALRDYSQHMQQLDYLYRTLGHRNVSLHAGELWLGLVHPKELRFHINDAIKVGHAKRIGHGTDIIFETGYKKLLEKMRDEGILVEISLTSSDGILGIKDDEHPISVYLKAGVPIALSTDDEGVSRIDLSHEYVRAIQEFDLSYPEIKEIAYNGLKYAFLRKEAKARLLGDLDQRFSQFESQFE